MLDVKWPQIPAGFRLISLLILVSAGCAGEAVPPLGVVKGTVTLDDNPLAEATVQFIPTSGKGGGSAGVTDSNGEYSLRYPPNHPGAVIGEHTVRITAKSGAAASAEPVPAKYNEKSTLKVTVEPGDNTHDFELTSK